MPVRSFACRSRHGEGNYEADEETVKRLEGEGRVLYRYCSADGVVDEESNINGAAQSIAGIVNERGNVLGMMPHPENHVEDIMGCTDGRGLFAGLARIWKKPREIACNRDWQPRLRHCCDGLPPTRRTIQASHHHDRAVRGRRHVRRDRARGRRGDGQSRSASRS
jgi:hypothetical protein